MLTAFGYTALRLTVIVGLDFLGKSVNFESATHSHHEDLWCRAAVLTCTHMPPQGPHIPIRPLLEMAPTQPNTTKTWALRPCGKVFPSHSYCSNTPILIIMRAGLKVNQQTMPHVNKPWAWINGEWFPTTTKVMCFSDLAVGIWVLIADQILQLGHHASTRHGTTRQMHLASQRPQGAQMEGLRVQPESRLTEP